uniref:Uncharacterized protein n=1 Tax=Graphocephala atropunctata TaxID=36148 RepID=A0A1B6LUG9_9HEMI
MAIVSKSSDEEIERLCRDVLAQLTDSSYKSKNDSLSRLRLICGKGDCGCGVLTPAQSLRYLLRVQGDKTPDLSVGLSVIRNYASLASDKHWQIVLEHMLRMSLSDPASDTKNYFCDQLWNFPGLRFFTISLIEDFLQSKTHYVEEDVFEVFKEALQGVNAKCVWADQNLDRLVYWSSNSPKIFCTVTSVLNSWLRTVVSATGQYETCVSVVTGFVSKVRTKCTEHQRDYVLLYPAELHAIVSLLDIKPTFLPHSVASGGSLTLSTVVTLLRQSLQKKPIQTLCLLTHFPEWSYFIER